MSGDLQTLLEGLPFDRETLANLAAADPRAMREMLSTYLRDDEVDAILERVRDLVAHAD
ncbi:MAG: hypothetical protein RMA76_19850 [Deltaproteobacteria bacterium]